MSVHRPRTRPSDPVSEHEPKAEVHFEPLTTRRDDELPDRPMR